MGDNMIQDGKLIIQTEEGQQRSYSVLATFEIKEKNKTYILYTDYSKNEEGNIKIYSSIYNQNGDLEVIKEKEEIDFVQNYIEALEKDLKSGIKFF